jgi:hypothetical protein
MGDRKPSKFLLHLKGLAPDMPDDFLRTIWAGRLPQHIQAILAGQTDGSLDSVLHITDRICEVTPWPTTASVSPSMPNNTAKVMERVEELSRQVASLRHKPASAHTPEPTAAEPPSDTYPARQYISWYHKRFGDGARKCIPPCFRQQGNSTSGWLRSAPQLRSPLRHRPHSQASVPSGRWVRPVRLPT